MTPIGLDGCKGGWLAVAGRPPAVSAVIYERLEGVPEGMLVIDTPIGLPADWSTPRPTDRAARRLLSLLNRDGHKGVGSRVFPAPPRMALEMWRSGASQAEINATSTDKKVSAQAYNILDKIAAADAVVTPPSQEHMREGHPDLAFAARAGATLAPKKTVEGEAERRALLEAHAFDIDTLAASLGKKTRRWAFDDLLDACILNLVAMNCIDSTAQRLTPHPVRDSTGRDMAIWY